jgi:hypothetical protein
MFVAALATYWRGLGKTLVDCGELTQKAQIFVLQALAGGNANSSRSKTRKRSYAASASATLPRAAKGAHQKQMS